MAPSLRGGLLISTKERVLTTSGPGTMSISVLSWLSWLCALCHVPCTWLVQELPQPRRRPPAPLEDPLYLFRRRATGLLDIKDPGTLPDPDESRLAPGMPS
eukprot:scaffold9519_cov128-Isochrysis_galbana.AAC.5